MHAKLQGRYGGNLDCRELRAGATLVLPVAHDGARALLRRLQGADGRRRDRRAARGRRARHGQRGAPRAARFDCSGRASRPPRASSTLVSGTPLEWSARQAFRELLNWVTDDYDLPRPKAALLLAMVAQARHLPDQQHRLHGLLHDAARRARALLSALANQPARGDADHALDDPAAHAEQRRRGGSRSRRRGSGSTCRWSPTAGRSSRPETST